MSTFGKLLLTSGLTVLCSTTVMAGTGMDDCAREEQRLRTAEAEQCSGVNYVFNPSACFITRKQLAPYAAGKCRTSAQEHVAETQRVVPLPESRGRAGKVEDTKAVEAAPAATAGTSLQLPHQPSAEPVSEIESLRRDVAALRIEVERLKTEMQALRRAGNGH